MALAPRAMTRSPCHGTHEAPRRPGRAAAARGRASTKSRERRETAPFTLPAACCCAAAAACSGGREPLPFRGAAEPGAASDKGQTAGMEAYSSGPLGPGREEGTGTLGAILQKAPDALAHPQGPGWRQAAPQAPRLAPEEAGETCPRPHDPGLRKTPQGPLRESPRLLSNVRTAQGSAGGGQAAEGSASTRAGPGTGSPGHAPPQNRPFCLSAGILFPSFRHPTARRPGPGWKEDAARATSGPTSASNAPVASAGLALALPSPRARLPIRPNQARGQEMNPPYEATPTLQVALPRAAGGGEGGRPRGRPAAGGAGGPELVAAATPVALGVPPAGPRHAAGPPDRTLTCAIQG